MFLRTACMYLIYQITSFCISEYAHVLENRNVGDVGISTLYQALLPKKDRVERFHLFFFITTAKTTPVDCKQLASRNILWRDYREQSHIYGQ
jgi:hypothetical protein